MHLVDLVPPILRAAALTCVAAAVACSTARRPTAGDIADRTRPAAAAMPPLEEMRRRGPRVSVTTDHALRARGRLDARIRVEDDAYVLVVNVAPDGSASVLFPDSTGDDGLLLGGRTYVIPSFFPGYPAVAAPPLGARGRFIWHGRSTSGITTARGPGYTAVIASWRPFLVDAYEAEELFYPAMRGRSLARLEPYVVLPALAEIVAGAEPETRITLEHARYGGYGVNQASSLTTQRCAGFHHDPMQDIYVLNASGSSLGCGSYASRLVHGGSIDWARLPGELPRGLVPPRDTAVDSTKTDTLGAGSRFGSPRRPVEQGAPAREARAAAPAAEVRSRLSATPLMEPAPRRRAGREAPAAPSETGPADHR